MSIKQRVYIFLLNHHVLQVKPWNDPRRSPEDRARWIQAEPKSLKGKAA